MLGNTVWLQPVMPEKAARKKSNEHFLIDQE